MTDEDPDLRVAPATRKAAAMHVAAANDALLAFAALIGSVCDRAGQDIAGARDISHTLVNQINTECEAAWRHAKGGAEHVQSGDASDNLKTTQTGDTQ